MRTLYVKKGNYGFSTHLKNNYKGQECDMWVDVQFSKNNMPEDSCKIERLDDFLSCYPSKDGTKVKLVITNYRIVEGNNQPVTQMSQNTQDVAKEEKNVYLEDIQYDEDQLDLPF